MQSMQIAASEVWVTLIFCVILYLFRNELKQKKVTKILMLVCIVRLVSDAIAWGFDGLSGPFWGAITCASNYLTFVSNDLVSLVFSVFLWQLVERDGEKPPIILKAYWALEVVAISALTLNLYFGWFYSFDGDNLYSRGEYYQFTHVASVVALLVVLWMLLRYRKRFGKNLQILTWSYLIPMALATTYEFMNFGLSLQAYAQAFSALVAFFVAEIEIREDLLATHQKLERANKELKTEEEKLEDALHAEIEMDGELRKKQEQLSLALAAAQQANNAKTRFLNSMSHDIRTPMNAIIGFTALAESNVSEPDRVKEYLKKISISSEHLLSLINDILDMSRIESGKVQVNEKALHLPALIRDIRAIVQPSADEKSLSFDIDMADVVDKDVVADELKLTQILLNILSNGVKYNKPGGSLSLCVKQEKSASAGHATYHFIIKDTGIGMSKEYQKHIFETFTREETATVSGIQGTGLGMAITKKNVELLGGSIQVSSAEGVGSEFDVCLTFKLCSGSVKPRDSEEGSAARIEDCTGKRILLVEDNSLNQEIAVMVLEEAGFVVDVVDDGNAAVERMASAEPGLYDVVLMDIQMPTMNGYEATRRIRSMADPYCQQVPIVAMTANAFEEDKALALQAGMNDHLAKPINVDELMKVIAKVMGS